jgi:hypothetical protein
MDELVATTADADRLRDELAAIEEEQATLEAELAAFNADYLREVVTVLAELHELEARIAALVADHSGSPEDKAAASSARARARETTAAVKAIPPAPEPLPTGDLKKLFREAAKRMHPDLVRGSEGRTHAEAFMKRLNEAYRAVDADAIRDLVLQWDASPFAPARAAGEPQGLEAAVARAEHRLAQERDSELARIMERAMTAAAAGIDLLAEMRRDAEAALAVRRERLAGRTGSR